MFGADLLSIETGRAPDARIAQRALDILVHEARDIGDGLTAAKREWPSMVAGMSRRFRVHADDSEVSKKPRPDLAQTVPRGRRYGKRGEAHTGQFAKSLELRVELGNGIGLVRDQ